MFLSIFEHKLNKKNQVTLPAKLREELEREALESKSDSKTLFLYSPDPRCLYVYTRKNIDDTILRLRALTTDAAFRRGVLPSITHITPSPQLRSASP